MIVGSRATFARITTRPVPSPFIDPHFLFFSPLSSSCCFPASFLSSSVLWSLSRLATRNPFLQPRLPLRYASPGSNFPCYIDFALPPFDFFSNHANPFSPPLFTVPSRASSLHPLLSLLNLLLGFSSISIRLLSSALPRSSPLARPSLAPRSTSKARNVCRLINARGVPRIRYGESGTNGPRRCSIRKDTWYNNKGRGQ